MMEALKIGVTNANNVLSKGESYLNMLSHFVIHSYFRHETQHSKRSQRSISLNGECGFWAEESKL